MVKVQKNTVLSVLLLLLCSNCVVNGQYITYQNSD